MRTHSVKCEDRLLDSPSILRYEPGLDRLFPSLDLNSLDFRKEVANSQWSHLTVGSA